MTRRFELRPTVMTVAMAQTARAINPAQPEAARLALVPASVRANIGAAREMRGATGAEEQASAAGAAADAPRQRGRRARVACADEMLIELIGEGHSLEDLADLLEVKPATLMTRMKGKPLLWAAWLAKNPLKGSKPAVKTAATTAAQKGEETHRKIAAREAHAIASTAAAPLKAADSLGALTQAPVDARTLSPDEAASASIQSAPEETQASQPKAASSPAPAPALPPANASAESIQASAPAGAVTPPAPAAPPAGVGERGFTVNMHGGGRVVIRLPDGHASAMDLRLAAAALEAMADELARIQGEPARSTFAK